MRVVRDRADARWLPSRFRFALFRLLAYIRLRTARPEPRPGLALAVQRDQNAFETFFVTGVALVVGTAFVATLLADAMSIAAAIPLAFIVTVTSIQCAVLIVGALLLPMRRRVPTMAAASATLMLMIIAMATLLAVGESPVRHVGTTFLLGVAANALAAVVVFVLERRIAAAESGFGAES